MDDTLKDLPPNTIILYLCETQHLILKPNTLYYFIVDENCEECRTIAGCNEAPDAN